MLKYRKVIIKIGGELYMESMNKFKVLTIIIICLFTFAVAAMYSNTKEVSEDKANDTYVSKDAYKQSNGREKYDITDLVYSVEALEHRVDALEKKINEKNNSSSSSDYNE